MKLFSHPVLFFVALVVIGVCVLWRPWQNTQHADATTFVLEGIRQCAQQESRNTCLEDLASDTAEIFDPRPVFEVLRQNQEDPAVFAHCHTLLHFLGRQVYRRSGDLAQTLGNGGPECFAGYYHGALEQHLIDKKIFDQPVEQLTREVSGICGAPSGFTAVLNYNECLHGLGHALMFLTDGEIREALTLCDSLSSQSDRDWCYSGVFMENSTSATNKDHPSKYLKKDDPLYPCTILEDRYLKSCYTLQSFYFAQLSDYDWVKTAALCRRVPEQFRLGCFDAIGQSQAGSTPDISRMDDACRLIVETPYRLACISGIVGGLGGRYHNDEKMTLFCGQVSEDARTACNERLRIVAQQF